MDNPIIKKETDVYSRTGDSGLILGSSPPVVFEMNQLACEIWELIDGKRRRSEIIEEIKYRYLDVPIEKIQQDISDYIDELYQNQIISFYEE